MPAAPPDAELEQLLEHLRVHRGADFTGYKRPSLTRLVQRRMAVVGIDSYPAYQDHLEVDPGEFAALFDSLLINVTAFFRDGQPWRVMRENVLPQLLESLGPEEPIRVWSAACASGEEAYTTAVVLAELLGEDAFRSRVKIYATDIDEDALATARAGRYPVTALRDVEPELVERYFERDGDVVTFRADLRPSVIFGRHDLIQDAPISRVSLLTCRNTLMYFNAETQSRVLERFAFALADGGVLLLGKAEMLASHGDLFVPLDLGNRLFTKRHPSRPLRQRAAAAPAEAKRVAQVAFVHAPDPQFVLDGDGRLALINDAAIRQFGMSRSDLGRPFQDLQVSFSPVELRGPIATARGEQRPLQLKDVPYLRDGDTTWFDVQVVPLTESEGLLGVQVTFVDVSRYHVLSDALETATRELQTAYEELQSSNEELETTNEELQSAIEELETTNEELQSTNEELETMNEELQSTNEELQTLNDELRERTAEVNQVNSFLESILRGLGGGVVVLDADLVVRVWNSRAEAMWGLRSFEAEGRHILNLDVGLPVDTLRDTFRAVLAAEQDHVQTRVPAVNRLGRDVVCAVSCSPLRSVSGDVSGAILVIEEEEVLSP